MIIREHYKIRVFIKNLLWFFVAQAG